MVEMTTTVRRIGSSIARASTLIFFAGNVLLLILIIISGGSDNYPISRLYWVEGDTSGIPNAPNTTRWSYWGACSRSNGHTHCKGFLGPAYPISPVDNFGTRTNVPQKFISKRSSLYYLSRLAFSFFWIALSFIAISFLIYVGAWFSHAVSYVTWVLTGIGCLFNIVAVIFQTAAAVMARDAFTDASRHGKLGAPLLGIAWASVALCMIEFTSLVLGHFIWNRPSRGDRLHEKAELPSVTTNTNARRDGTEPTNRFRTFFTGPRKDAAHYEAERAEPPSETTNANARPDGTEPPNRLRTFFVGPRKATAPDETERAEPPSTETNAETEPDGSGPTNRFRTLLMGSRKGAAHDESERPKTNAHARSDSASSAHPLRTFFLGPRNARTYDDAVSKQRESDQGYTISSGTTEGGNGAVGSGEPAVNFSNVRRSEAESHDSESV